MALFPARAGAKIAKLPLSQTVPPSMQQVDDSEPGGVVSRTNTEPARSRPSLSALHWRGWLLGVSVLAVGAFARAGVALRSEALPTSSPFAAAAPASDVARAGSFVVAMQPVGSYHAGEPGQVKVVLLARGSYKVNEKYPLKLELRPVPGIQFESEILRKDAAKFAPKRVVLPATFVAQTSGRQRISGRLKFSVCTDRKCIVDQRELTLQVTID